MQALSPPWRPASVGRSQKMEHTEAFSGGEDFHAHRGGPQARPDHPLPHSGGLARILSIPPARPDSISARGRSLAMIGLLRTPSKFALTLSCHVILLLGH
jgi:hypothetical protein